MTLAQGELGKEYTIVRVDTEDEELNDFLLTLGCYEGEKIVLVTFVSESFVVAIRDGRYNINQELAEAIVVTE